ncbi:phosphate acetyltransferase [Nonlabens sp.]|uniref:phosphate acetyltransferase n=1 Tax=Nonlabens sp. TaxID=1888209 RepID=UPI0025F06E85|nr:phosphate acetyltransferase [Nonlabens sp.]
MTNPRANKAIYIATTSSHSGKSIASLGLLQLLLKKVLQVGYFRPVIDDIQIGEVDNHIHTITSFFKLDLKIEDAYAFQRSDLLRKINENKEDEIISTIIDKFKTLEKRFDFIIVEGTSFSGQGAMIELDMNVVIAKNLGIPVIILASGEGSTLEGVVGDLQLAYDSFKDKEVEVLSLIANKVALESQELIGAELKKQFPSNLIICVIPFLSFLSQPSIEEIIQELNAQVLFGAAHSNNQVGDFSVAAMQVQHYLPLLKENSLVITSGDRSDILLGVLQANRSVDYPSISGILLTSGLLPEEAIMKLIEDLAKTVPVISVKGSAFSVANHIGTIKSQIQAQNTQKIEASIKVFDTYMPEESLLERLVTYTTKGMSSRMFQYHLLKQARSNKKHIVLPEGLDERILRATKKIIDADAAFITLLGDKKQIEDKLAVFNIDLSLDQITIVNPSTSVDLHAFAKALYELRKHKNVNLAMAKDLMEDVSYYGTMMVYQGKADGMVSGAVHTTQHTIMPALQFIKTKPEASIVSSVFFMCLENRIAVFGDCAINPNPTAEQLAEIAISSAATSRAFGIEPKIAMLSYSSGVSGKGEDVERVRKATELIKQKRPDLKVEGPIQYDAAVDMKIGKAKMPDSEVAGQASVFIFPDLNTGNNTYKAVQRETKALAIGPIIQGLNKPVNDLSRGCTVEDVFNTVVVTAIQAQGV